MNGSSITVHLHRKRNKVMYACVLGACCSEQIIDLERACYPNERSIGKCDDMY